MRVTLTGLALATAMTLSGAVAAAPTMAAAPVASHTELVSASPSGVAGDRAADPYPAISDDGRFVAFSSPATNIGDVPTTGSVRQVYLRDVETGATRMISAAGTIAGNGDSFFPSVSADGSTVAYVSSATNLVGGTSAGIRQVLVWSEAIGTRLVSISGDAVPTSANGPAREVAISGDGHVVAFTSDASNLSRESTRGVTQLFARDLTAGVTTMVSVDATLPGSGGASASLYPDVSYDGRTVVFTSRSALSGLPTSDDYNVYARDSVSAVTRLVSVNVAGTAAAGGVSSSVSADGRFVVFCSGSADVAPGVDAGLTQVYLRDMQSGVTRLVSHDVSGTHASNGGTASPSISADGQHIAFISTGGELVAEGSGSPGTAQAYLTDLMSGKVHVVSRTSAVRGFGDRDSFRPQVSGDGGLVAFSSQATDLLPTPATGDTQIYVRNTDEAPTVDRIGGADRFAVSAAVATDTFGWRVPVVYIASGATFADALSGSAAAGFGHGVVLLVTKDSIPAPVVSELRRLSPLRIVVLGGLQSVGLTVERDLADFAPTVRRMAGADRYEVSAAISALSFGQPGDSPSPTVYIASGEVYPDALSGSAAAGRLGGPVLLVRKTEMPPAVAAELRRLRPGKIVVLGGVNTISASVVSALNAVAPTTRIGGSDRFELSAAVSADTFPAGAAIVYVASGAVFPDALSGSAAAIQNDGPVLLVTKDGIPASVASELDRLDPTRIVVLGGTNTVSDAVLHDLEQYVGPRSLQ